MRYPLRCFKGLQTFTQQLLVYLHPTLWPHFQLPDLRHFPFQKTCPLSFKHISSKLPLSGALIVEWLCLEWRVLPDPSGLSSLPSKAPPSKCSLATWSCKPPWLPPSLPNSPALVFSPVALPTFKTLHNWPTVYFTYGLLHSVLWKCKANLKPLQYLLKSKILRGNEKSEIARTLECSQQRSPISVQPSDTEIWRCHLQTCPVTLIARLGPGCPWVAGQTSLALHTTADTR